MKISLYQYPACSTCRKAVGFLRAQQIDFDNYHIVDQPPSKAMLKKMLGFLGNDLRKLFNTSGTVYRELGIKDRLTEISQDQALDLLASNGKLIKRPFLLTEIGGLVGFKEAEWVQLLEQCPRTR